MDDLAKMEAEIDMYWRVYFALQVTWQIIHPEDPNPTVRSWKGKVLSAQREIQGLILSKNQELAAMRKDSGC